MIGKRKKKFKEREGQKGRKEKRIGVNVQNKHYTACLLLILQKYTRKLEFASPPSFFRLPTI